MANFSNLDQVFMMTSPSDASGRKILETSRKSSEPQNIEELFAYMLDNRGRGVESTEQFVNKLVSFHNKHEGELKLPEGTRLYSTATNLPSDKNIAGLDSITGTKIKSATVFSRRTPRGSGTSGIYAHPSTLGTRKVEIFLNCMPSNVIASLVPVLDVEFQIVNKNSRLGQLRFLLGDSVDDETNPPPGNYFRATQNATQRFEKNGDVSKFSGMESFVSPQTLVQAQPNLMGNRYNNVLDPFRPFASIESLSVSVVPTVGWDTNKTAQLNIKLHDRSRLNEISDLVRPQIYHSQKTTVWLTYGWRAPSYGTHAENPYFDYINENMVMREAYHIKNASFSFDPVGQVSITLELFTMGSVEFAMKPITEALALNISEAPNSVTVKQLITERKNLASDIVSKFNESSSGPDEIRGYQIINATNEGKFTAFTKREAINLIDTLRKNKGLKDNDKIIEDLKKLYVTSNGGKDTESKIKEAAAKEAANRIKELREGSDPFLDGLPDDLRKRLDTNQKPGTREIVSFGKLFSVFALNCMVTNKDIDDIQVFFYGLNDGCGPVSGYSVAEIPVKISYFNNVYSSLVQSLGTEDVPMGKFLEFIRDSMLLDDRSPAFGFDKYYSSPSDGSAPTISNQSGYDSAMEKYLREYGSYRKPFIEVYAESSYEVADDAGKVDQTRSTFDSMYNKKGTLTQSPRDTATKKVLRIHIYDKVVNPYQSLNQKVIKSSKGVGYVIVDKADKNSSESTVNFQSFNSSTQVSDYLSRFVPTITHGTNGSTIISANLSTKFDALQSTVAMQRSNVVENTVQPNGSGPGGVPLRVIPATLSLTTMGCPIARMNQIYYVNFSTGTTVDNFYNCTSITHTMTPGKFETQWSLAPCDAYGIFEGAPTFDQLKKVVENHPAATPTKNTSKKANPKK